MAQLDQTSKELESELLAVQQATDQLRINFEQYFLGMERRPPSDERDSIKQRVTKLRSIPSRNTALRFRITQLAAKFQTLDTYWTRVCRQIEDGTYQRDARKAERRARNKAEPADAHAETSTAPTMVASPPAQSSGLSDEQINLLFKTLLKAKRRCKEDTRNFTRDGLANMLRDQLPAIKKQYGGRSVEFKVVIKDGKALLKAGPKS